MPPSALHVYVPARVPPYVTTVRPTPIPLVVAAMISMKSCVELVIRLAIVIVPHSAVPLSSQVMTPSPGRRGVHVAEPPSWPPPPAAPPWPAPLPPAPRWPAPPLPALPASAVVPLEP